MNYGADPADQVVRYYLEGTEYALKLSGTAAKNFAVLALAILKDQKKTHGKTNLVRLLREGKPLKFFSVPAEDMADFAYEAKMFGLLYVPIKDKADPDTIEIAVLAEDAAKVNRIIDRMQLDIVDVGDAEAMDPAAQNRATPANEQTAPATQTVQTDTGPVAFEVGEEERLFGLGFTQAGRAPAQQPAPENPSAPSLPNSGPFLSSSKTSPQPQQRMDFTDRAQHPGTRPSVKEELRTITAMLHARRRGEPQPLPKRPIKINRERMM